MSSFRNKPSPSHQVRPKPLQPINSDSDYDSDDDNMNKTKQKSPQNKLPSFSFLSLLQQTQQINNSDVLDRTHDMLDQSQELLKEALEVLKIYETNSALTTKTISHLNANPTPEITNRPKPHEEGLSWDLGVGGKNDNKSDKKNSKKINKFDLTQIQPSEPIFDVNMQTNSQYKLKYPSYGQLNRFTASSHQLNELEKRKQSEQGISQNSQNSQNCHNETVSDGTIGTNKVEIETVLPTFDTDYDNILKFNVDKTLELLFQQSFLPLITQLQAQWLPLLQYSNDGNNELLESLSEITHTALKPPHSDPHETQIAQNEHGIGVGEFIGTKGNALAKGHDVRDKLHTQPISAIIDLHIQSFQTLLSFHSSHRESRLQHLNTVISSWLITTKNLKNYYQEFLIFSEKQYKTIGQNERIVLTLSTNLQQLKQIIAQNIKKITQGVLQLITSLEYFQSTERHFKLFQQHLLGSCPNILKIAGKNIKKHSPDQKSPKNDPNNDNFITLASTPIASPTTPQDSDVNGIDTQLARISSPNHSLASSSLILSNDLAQTNAVIKAIKGDRTPEWNFFTIPIHLLQNIVSFMTVDDVQTIQQISYPYYKLFSSSLVYIPLLLTSIRTAQKLVQTKRKHQERIESLFANGTQLQLVVPKTQYITEIQRIKEQNQINFNHQYALLAQQIEAGQSPTQQATTVSSFFSGLAAPLLGQNPTNQHNSSSQVSNHPQIIALVKSHQDKLKSYETNFFQEVFSHLQQRVIERISASEHQRDELRVQIQAITPLVEFLTVECDGVRSVFNGLQEQSLDLTQKQSKYESDKKVLLYTIQLHESNHKALMLQSHNSELSAKNNLKALQQKVQLVEDMQYSASGNTGAHRGSAGNSTDGKFTPEEEKTLQSLKSEKKSLIKQVKQIRGQFESILSGGDEINIRIGQLFETKLQQEREDMLAHFILAQAKQRQELGHSMYDIDVMYNGGSGNTKSGLKKEQKSGLGNQPRFQCLNLQLKLPTYEEFLQLSEQSSSLPTSPNLTSPKSQQKKQNKNSATNSTTNSEDSVGANTNKKEFVWDIKQFIVVNESQEHVYLEQTKPLAQVSSTQRQYQEIKQKSGQGQDDGDGFEIISL